MASQAQLKIAGRKTTVRELSPADLRRLQLHRFAGLFPPLEGGAYDLLRDSLREHGYDAADPIVVNASSGEIVDGRNRRDACVELRVPATVAFVHFLTEPEIAGYVVQVNLARRHLGARDFKALVKRLASLRVDTKTIAAATGRSPQRVRAVTVAERAAAKAERDEAIRAAAASGASERQAAKAGGVDKATARRVVQNAHSERNAPPATRPKRTRRSSTIVPIDEPEDTVENAAAMLRLTGISRDDAVEALRLLTRFRKSYGADRTAEDILPWLWKLLELAGKRDPAAFLNFKTGGA